MTSLTGLRLRFEDAGLESRFVAYYNRTYIVQARFALALGILLVGFDALADTLAEPGRFYLGNQIRLFAVIPFLALGVVGSFTPFARRNFQIAVLVWGALAGIALLSAMTALEVESERGLSSWVGLLNFVFIMIFAFVLMGLQFRNACLIGFSLFVAFVVLLAIFAPFAAGEIVYQLYHLLSVVALVVFLSYARERFIRRDFASQAALAVERERSEQLLYNTLPPVVAERMKAGERPIADALPEVVVLFADVVGFTPMAAQIGPDAVVRFLNGLFTEFDHLVAQHGLEKVKTIGDAYMVISPDTDDSEHVSSAARLGLAMIESARKLAVEEGRQVDLRVGIHLGPAVAGVIGETKFQYDVWGDTVNIASRLEETGVPGRVQISEAVHARLGGEVAREPRGETELKGRGAMTTYLLITDV